MCTAELTLGVIFIDFYLLLLHYRNMNSKTNGVVNGGGVDHVEQPDPDYIKMFVGQIPRSMDEEQLRIMFEEYGRVHQINVLRDKVTGQSKGK